jgi:hypothetical protein
VKKFLASIVLGLLWSLNVNANEDIKKIKSLTCEFIGKNKDTPATETFKIKKKSIKSKTWGKFKNLEIDNNSFKASTTKKKILAGIIYKWISDGEKNFKSKMIITSTILVDLNKGTAKIFLSGSINSEELEDEIVEYRNCS